MEDTRCTLPLHHSLNILAIYLMSGVMLGELGIFFLFFDVIQCECFCVNVNFQQKYALRGKIAVVVLPLFFALFGQPPLTIS
ncbi:hypothetical protein BH11PSE12_BH11PSE12_13180 [soil metagenome]